MTCEPIRWLFLCVDQAVIIGWQHLVEFVKLIFGA